MILKWFKSWKVVITSKLNNVVPLISINKVKFMLFKFIRTYVLCIYDSMLLLSWIVILQLVVGNNFVTLIFLIIIGVELGCYKLVSEQVGLSGQCRLMLFIPLYAISVWNTVSTCCVSDLLFAGFGLNLTGGEAVLLGYNSIASCWCSVLLKETV